MERTKFAFPRIPICIERIKFALKESSCCKLFGAPSYTVPKNSTDSYPIIPGLCIWISRNIIDCSVFVDDCFNASIYRLVVVLGMSTWSYEKSFICHMPLWQRLTGTGRWVLFLIMFLNLFRLRIKHSSLRVYGELIEKGSKFQFCRNCDSIEVQSSLLIAQFTVPRS